jgi:signal transduction histidine kinase
MLNILLFLMLTISPATQPEQLFVASDSLFNENGIITLSSQDGWRFHPGDDLSWADPDFDDSDWISFRPAGLTSPIPDSLWSGYGWFRYRFAVDSSIYAMPILLYFSTWGAAEVYLDGKLLREFGVFSADPKSEKRYMPKGKIHPAVVLQHADSHVLAVRFSYHKGQQYKKLLGKYAATFGFGTGLAKENLNYRAISINNANQQRVYILGTMLFLIVLLHSLLFGLFPSEKSNLYIAIVALLLFMHIVLEYSSLFFEFDILQETLFRIIPFNLLFTAAVSLFPLTINSIFNQKPKIVYKIIIWLFPVFALADIIISMNFIMSAFFVIGIIFLTAKELIQAWRNKQKGVWIIAAAFFSLILSALIWTLYMQFTNIRGSIINTVLTYFIYGSVPVGLTVYTAIRFRELYANLEQKVKERTRELSQSLENLRSTQSQLINSEKLASLGALTAGIAHEIQNPLNFVNNFAEVSNEMITELKGERLKDKEERDEELEGEILQDISQNLGKILHHGKRAESIVKGMLLHSRGSSGHKEPTDINALCDEYLRLSYHGFRAKDKTFNAEYKTDLNPGLPKIHVVPQDIGRVLLNLINNAFYAVNVRRNTIVKTTHALSQTSPPSNPTVTVTTKNLGNRIEIAVKDNGNGIPEEIKDKIFQPFFTTKPTGQGTGLGLSLAYDIVKAHGGELEVKSIENEGAEFIIILPNKNYYR